MPDNSGKEVATLGGGCFWCLEAALEQLRGVEKVVSGYSGGSVANPGYREVCGGRTGHAEVVQVTFDPAVLSGRPGYSVARRSAPFGPTSNRP
jgi:peptide-methionine (S)-S-oxide reductase